MTGQQIADILFTVLIPAFGPALAKERSNNASMPLLFIEPEEDGTPEDVLFDILKTVQNDPYNIVIDDSALRALAQEGTRALRAAGFPY